MSATTGISPVASYTAGTNKERIARLRSLIPDPDVAPSQAGNGTTLRIAGFLDQMSPPCAAQLLVELVALEAAVTN